MAKILNSPLSLEDIRKVMCKYKIRQLVDASGADIPMICRFRSGQRNTMTLKYFLPLLNFLYYDNKTEKGI